MKVLLKMGTLVGGTALGVLALSTVNSAQACGPEPYIGSICITAANFCPRGYFSAAGQRISIAEYTTLYAVMGNTFGGDGRIEFGLPDARSRELVHAGTSPGLNPIQLGEYMGYDNAPIPSYYFPAHEHEIDLSKAVTTTNVLASKNAANVKIPANNYFADTTQQVTNYATTSNLQMASGTVTAKATAATGTINHTGNVPETQQRGVSPLGPQLGLNVCVAYDGSYPPRP